MIFKLESWEFFEAPINAAGDTVPITEVWIDDEQHRIYGQSPVHGDPVWLSPKIVPGRVLRRDNSKPKHPLEWREIFQTRRTAAELDEDEKLAARIAAIPEPIERARPMTLEEMPGGMVRLGKQAADAGFTQRATIAHGPRLDQYWRVVEFSRHALLKGEHRDGRRFVAAYITKTPGEGTKNAGIPQWKPETVYARIEGIWTPCGISDLGAYFTNGSLTQQKEAS